MKRICTMLIGILLLLPLAAQDYTYRINTEVPSVIARISLIAPKLVIEFAPANHFSFTTGFWIHPTFRPEDENGDRVFHPVPTLNPRLTMEPRYYFNMGDRARRGKRTDYYSGWYVGIPFAMEFRTLEYSLGTTMGFQCSFGRHWYWNFGFGPGFAYEKTTFRMRAVGDVGFGFIINQSR